MVPPAHAAQRLLESHPAEDDVTYDHLLGRNLYIYKRPKRQQRAFPLAFRFLHRLLLDGVLLGLIGSCWRIEGWTRLRGTVLYFSTPRLWECAHIIPEGLVFCFILLSFCTNYPTLGYRSNCHSSKNSNEFSNRNKHTKPIPLYVWTDSQTVEKVMSSHFLIEEEMVN